MGNGGKVLDFELEQKKSKKRAWGFRCVRRRGHGFEGVPAADTVQT